MRHNPRGPAAAFGGFKNMKKGNPIALLRNPGAPTLVLLAAIVVLVLLVVLIAMLLRRRRSRKAGQKERRRESGLGPL